MLAGFCGEKELEEYFTYDFILFSHLYINMNLSFCMYNCTYFENDNITKCHACMTIYSVCFHRKEGFGKLKYTKASKYSLYDSSFQVSVHESLISSLLLYLSI